MMRVETESGSIYEFDGLSMRRVSKEPLRRDGEWVKILKPARPVIDEPMVLFLEPLGQGEFTTRITTPVVLILDDI